MLNDIKLALSGLESNELFMLSIIFLMAILVLLKKFFSNFYNKIIGKVENFIKPIADEAVKNSAKYLNSASGQAKMDAAVAFVKEKGKAYPWYIRIFLSKFNKKWLVDRIEDAYQLYKKTMNSNISNEELDIKGNETEVKKKLV